MDAGPGSSSISIALAIVAIVAIRGCHGDVYSYIVAIVAIMANLVSHG